MIIATAGHVDHGKTLLVRALTGVDGDRLPEEQRRGMTIEPGFAHADLGAGPIDFVDLPGHERFARHMLAGIGAVDAALLVVAADDGPMPQTREHLAVLDLLGLCHGVAVLTKIDRVPPERVEQVRHEVAALLAGTSLAGVAILPVSTVRGDGLDGLRATLLDLQRTLPPGHAGAQARLALDRCFLRPGAGVVVAGTLLSGRATIDDELVALPTGSPVRVRALQVHGQPVAAVEAGQRCALNLAPAHGERLQVERGDWLVAPALAMAATRIDVRLRWLATVPRALAADATLQLHLGATQRNARVQPLDRRAVAPGEAALVQLLLDAPVSVLHGERLVLRDAAAHAIVGGATVLDPWAPARGRARPERLADLQAQAEADPHVALSRLLAAHPEGLEWPPFARARNLPDAALADVQAALGLQVVPHAQGLRLIAPLHWQALQASLLEALAAAHAAQPDSVGLSEAALLRAAGTDADLALKRAALRARLTAGAIVRDGFVLRRPDHAPRLQPEDEALLQRVVAIIQPFGLRPPPPGELAPLLEMELKPLSAFLQRAAALGHLVQVAKNRFFLPATIHALADVARACAATAPDGRFDARSFRDRSGIGRNLTIQLLEFFDRCGITRYAGERRTMAPSDERD